MSLAGEMPNNFNSTTKKVMIDLNNQKSSLLNKNKQLENTNTQAKLSLIDRKNSALIHEDGRNYNQVSSFTTDLNPKSSQVYTTSKPIIGLIEAKSPIVTNQYPLDMNSDNFNVQKTSTPFSARK